MLISRFGSFRSTITGLIAGALLIGSINGAVAQEEKATQISDREEEISVSFRLTMFLSPVKTPETAPKSSELAEIVDEKGLEALKSELAKGGEPVQFIAQSEGELSSYSQFKVFLGDEIPYMRVVADGTELTSYQGTLTSGVTIRLLPDLPATSEGELPVSYMIEADLAMKSEVTMADDASASSDAVTRVRMTAEGNWTVEADGGVDVSRTVRNLDGEAMALTCVVEWER